MFPYLCVLVTLAKWRLFLLRHHEVEICSFEENVLAAMGRIAMASGADRGDGY